MADAPAQVVPGPPTLYANHVQVQPNDFDLRILFGEQIQTGDGFALKQLAGVRLSWLEAKLFSHFLQVTLAAFEIQNGKINVPKSVIPPAPVSPTQEEFASEPKSKEIYEAMLKMHNQLFSQ